MAAVAVRVLRQVLLSFADVAARISTVFARAVEYDPVTAEVARSALREAGLSSWQVDGRLKLYEWISHDAMGGVTEDVRKMTGREPRPLEDWLGEARAAFLRPPGTPAPIRHRLSDVLRWLDRLRPSPDREHSRRPWQGLPIAWRRPLVLRGESPR